MRFLLSVFLTFLISLFSISAQSERPESIVIPVSSLGDVSDTRKKILQNTLEDELKEHFMLISQERFEEAQEKAFEELDYEECTEDQCIMMIQEMLQVENVFHLEVIGEGTDTQLSLSWRTLDEKKKETEVCIGCGTFELNEKVDGLVIKLIGVQKSVLNREPKKIIKPFVIEKSNNIQDISNQLTKEIKNNISQTKPFISNRIEGCDIYCDDLLMFYNFEKNHQDSISKVYPTGSKGKIVNIPSKDYRNGMEFYKNNYLKIQNKLINKYYQVVDSFSVIIIFKINNIIINKKNYLCKDSFSGTSGLFTSKRNGVFINYCTEKNIQIKGVLANNHLFYQRIKLDQFYILSLNYDKDNSRFVFVLNDKLIGTKTINLDGEFLKHFIIANYSYSNTLKYDNGIDGIIDEIRIYKRMLDIKEIKLLYSHLLL